MLAHSQAAVYDFTEYKSYHFEPLFWYWTGGGKLCMKVGSKQKKKKKRLVLMSKKSCNIFTATLEAAGSQ